MAEQHSTVSSDVLPLLRIAVTSYEGSLFGWNVFENASNSGLESKMVFGFNCCQSSLRALAVSPSGRYIACGGMDERIRLYDMTTNRSIGEISNQSGAINCLRFFGDSYLLNGSEDNTVGVWRTNDWLCVHTLGGHKAPINDLSIHPSGKLALSVSKDNTMKMWNLVHGRCSFTRRLKGSADKVHWNDTGDSYLLVINTVLHVYLAADNSCVINTDLKSRVNEAVFTSIAPDGDGSTDASASARIACICENKILTLFDMKGTKTASLDLSTVGGRLRDMKSVVLPPTERLSPQCLSEGPVKQALEGEGGLLTVVTSVGKVIVLSCRELEAGGSLEECQLASSAVRVEPRFISAAAWVPTSAVIKQANGGKNKGSKDPKNGKKGGQTTSSTDVANDEVREDADTLQSGVERKNGKKKNMGENASKRKLNAGSDGVAGESATEQESSKNHSNKKKQKRKK